MSYYRTIYKGYTIECLVCPLVFHFCHSLNMYWCITTYKDNKPKPDWGVLVLLIFKLNDILHALRVVFLVVKCNIWKC